jgi:hypothetical protein
MVTYPWKVEVSLSYKGIKSGWNDFSGMKRTLEAVFRGELRRCLIKNSDTYSNWKAVVQTQFSATPHFPESIAVHRVNDKWDNPLIFLHSLTSHWTNACMQIFSYIFNSVTYHRYWQKIRRDEAESKKNKPRSQIVFKSKASIWSLDGH